MLKEPPSDLEKRVENIKDVIKGKRDDFTLEQYKILFNVIVSLNDSVVKSVLTIFIIFTTIIAIVVRGMDENPLLKNVLYINYALIMVFAYYLGYLRFRIVTMFHIVEEIEKGEDFKYPGIMSYEKKTNWRFYSTRGLFWVIVLTLIIINTLIIIILKV